MTRLSAKCHVCGVLLVLLSFHPVIDRRPSTCVQATATSTRKYHRSRLPWVSHPPQALVATGLITRTRGGEDFQKSQKHDEEEETSVTTSSSSSSSNATVKEYVAAVEEIDAQHRSQQRTPSSSLAAASTRQQSPHESDQARDDRYDQCSSGNQQQQGDSKNPGDFPAEGNGAGVSVKSPKKSNAVGDPDGSDSDDDTDDLLSTDDEDWEDFDQDEGLEMELLPDDSADDQELQVQVDFVEGEGLSEDEIVEDESERGAKTTGGGGIARLGQRVGRRKSRKQDWRNLSSHSRNEESEQIIDAWLPHVYLPPSPDAVAHLIKNARMIDSASKSRLDRRTLYSALLLEWLNQSSSNRKFLDAATAQTLQAALSLATQPHWRKSLKSRPNAIRLFEHEVGKSCTLSMQETIVMALAHSLGAAMVIIDDETLMSVRKQLAELGYSNEDLKSAALVKALINSAQGGKLSTKVGGSIAKCMKRDLSLELDDPYDDRAKSSCEDMATWEENWHSTTPDSWKEKDLPLVLFVRTQSADFILKSKSAVDSILKECNSEESINLLVLGNGINSRTLTLPKDNKPTPNNMGGFTPNGGSNYFNTNGMNGMPPSGQMKNPFFGLAQQNQNASGQNDPEGSRRFNIFLTRTMDSNGVTGILGSIAPPEAGNLFPHMMLMQARERLKNEDDDSPARAELEQWSQTLLQQMQQNQNMAGQNLAGQSQQPQFFNASLGSSFGPASENQNPSLFMQPNYQLPPQEQEMLQRTLEHALEELLDRLAEMDDGPPPTSMEDLSPDLEKAFAQVLRNPNIRKGIADNLAKAAPALADPKCQGVMLSVFVPPQRGNDRLPGNKPQSNVGGWFQKILHNQEAAESAADAAGEPDEGRKRKARQKRARTLAAMHAVMASKNAQDSNSRSNKSNKLAGKIQRNLADLEAASRPVPIKAPSDPVRAKSWDGWIGRERGAVIFRRNRKALNNELQFHNLTLQQHTGTRGAGSSLRQMLSVRDVTEEMDEVIKCAVELEAAKGQRLHETPHEMHKKEMHLGVDITLSQLLMKNGELEVGDEIATTTDDDIRYLHPSSLETALSLTCRVSPSPAGGMSVSGSTTLHRSKEEIANLAQDKHERALVSQVVSPQDIGVTYDMIGGLTEVKELLRQSITYPLKFPHLYSEGIAREAVKGVLLFGPPGTGKTMLAKAVATEGGASFLSVDASSVENKWLGESEKNAKAVFTLARRLAPCVIFIDEVDSLLSSREGGSDDSAHGTLTSVKTTMMSEWDGLSSGTNGVGEAGSDRVVVIGSTNRPFDLDEAVLRRFPRRILVDLPDLETRKEILEVTLAENRLDPKVNLTAIAERLEGYTGSDLKEVCREAVVQISHEQAQLLDQGFGGDSRKDITEGSLQRLRPVNMEDFEKALSKLKRSVSEKGRELSRVWEWNDEYGEIKKEKKNHLPHLMNMYL